MNWLSGRRSALSMHNKQMLYKQILKPVWTYGIQLWGCTKQSNIDIIQRFKNKVPRNIVDAPWYIRNANLRRDLQMEIKVKVKVALWGFSTLRPFGLLYSYPQQIPAFISRGATHHTDARDLY